ncbi:MAG: proton-conducting transporter membrane subunit [Victivallaceae bacterium]|nr:proton-conducting transporter membrane subunit [Victivallaceae bacterium]MDD4181620.1 proton-conducting transporter membrane subunit [Victivallaceae bacterium]
MITLFVLIPALIGLLCLLIKSSALRVTMIVAATLHLGLTVSTFFCDFEPFYHGWFAINSASQLFLLALSVLFFVVACYSRDYMGLNSRIIKYEARYSCCMLLMLSAMSLVLLSRHFGVMWIAMEATTLFSAPLIYFHRSHTSLEATWKYLMICSIGIALALLGNILLAYAYRSVDSPLLLDNLLPLAASGDIKWLKAAFIFFVIGYGTKMGLAPMHSWLPDAYSEAPPPVSAIFPALMHCAFLLVMRVGEVCQAAGLGSFRNEILIFFAVASLLFAAIFIIGQKDYPRMLAYSSIEHIGLMTLGAACGVVGMVGSLLHMLNHTMIKGMLFMISGNILAIYRSRNVNKVGGMLQISPLTGIMWLAGFMAITGLPPFGMFISKLMIIRSMLDSGVSPIVFVVLLLLVMIFIGMLVAFIPMTMGSAPSGTTLKPSNPRLRWLLLPAAVLGLISLLLGVCVPNAIYRLIMDAAAILSG